ncbi:hypothetical protein FRB97_007655 [Tulasnella sp. 331]|nr:hypothetical protein FRB97_007655 [Tulasnella sp. 331]
MVASAHRRPTAPRQTPPITAPTDLQVYDIEDVFIGRTFLEGFDFFTGSDPTHGRVNPAVPDVTLYGYLVGRLMAMDS